MKGSRPFASNFDQELGRTCTLDRLFRVRGCAVWNHEDRQAWAVLALQEVLALGTDAVLILFSFSSSVSRSKDFTKGSQVRGEGL